MNFSHHLTSDLNVRLNSEGITVYSIQDRAQVVQDYHKENFYKISLLSGKGCVQYGVQTIEINGSALLLCKPGTMYTWRFETDEPSYTCIITQEFLSTNCFQCLDQSKQMI